MKKDFDFYWRGLVGGGEEQLVKVTVTPVCQVEDSEDEAACQPTQHVHDPAPVRQVKDSEDEAACQPTPPVHDPPPVRQVRDSEGAAQPIQKEVVTEQADTALSFVKTYGLNCALL